MAGVQLRAVRAALPISVLLAFIAGGTLIVGQRLDGGVRLNGIVQGIYSIANSGLGTTSTDGFTIQNTTPSTAATTVQMSPRVRLCGSAWNSSALLSETDCMFWEVLPATVAGTTNQVLRFGSIINGAAATFPFTVGNTGILSLPAGITQFQQGANGGFGLGSNGTFTIVSNGVATGVTLKADALPSVSACGAGSPAVVTGSTPWYGAVTIGTTAVATCTITFNGTAYPSAPHCSGVVETTTPANIRAMGYSASTTVLTIVPASAWADSSVVNWTCGSSK